MSEITKAIEEAVNAEAPALRKIARDIWANPELGLEEHKASGWLTDYLSSRGFDLEAPVGGLKTAFRAKAGSGRPVAAFLCEYDALPEIGHGCGHNLIAVVGAAAGAGLKGAMESAGGIAGTVQVLGTPGEEGLGGKVIMIENGVFDDVDFALLAHPSTDDRPDSGCSGVTRLTIRFHGKTSHAAGSPDKGINALDAIIATFNGINAIRQHILEDSRIHGVITNGGVRPNIVPDLAEAQFYVRHFDDGYRRTLVDKVTKIAEGAGLMTGARLQIEETSRAYRSRVPCPVLGRLFAEEAEARGFAFPAEPRRSRASSDFGNVSWIVPAIHPYFQTATPGTPGHSREFALQANTDEAFAKAMTAAKALAITAARVLQNPALLEEAKRLLAERTASAQAGPAG